MGKRGCVRRGEDSHCPTRVRELRRIGAFELLDVAPREDEFLPTRGLRLKQSAEEIIVPRPHVCVGGGASLAPSPAMSGVGADSSSSNGTPKSGSSASRSGTASPSTRSVNRSMNRAMASSGRDRPILRGSSAARRISSTTSLPSVAASVCLTRSTCTNWFRSSFPGSGSRWDAISRYRAGGMPRCSHRAPPMRLLRQPRGASAFVWHGGHCHSMMLFVHVAFAARIRLSADTHLPRLPNLPQTGAHE